MDRRCFTNALKHHTQKRVAKNQSYWVFHPALNRCWWVLKPLNVSASHIIMSWWISRSKERLFFYCKRMMFIFYISTALLFFLFFNISLSLPLSQCFFCHSFILFNHACCSCGTKVVNNLINVSDQYASNYTTLRRNQWKRAVVFLYLCRFICSSLWL